MSFDMFLLKKYSAVFSVIALIFLMDLRLHELRGVGASVDHSKADLALKYPLTIEGMLALKADETLLHELVDRYEAEQVVLSAKELETLPTLFMRLAEDYSTKEKFSKAAKYFLRAEDLGDPTARKGFLGLANTLKNLPKRQRKIQAQKLSQIYQQDAERGGTQSFMIRAEVYAIEKDDGKAMEYYLKAAHQGDAQAYSKAYDYYCMVYAIVTDSITRLARCVEAVEKEEENSNPHAAYMRAELLLKDFRRQMECYTKAAKWGHPEAWTAAGNCYVETMKRDRVSREHKVAFAPLLAHYRECAEQGDEAHYLNIADMYKKGIGDDPDKENLTEWYGKEVACLSRLAGAGDDKAYQEALSLSEGLVKESFAPDQRLRIFKPLFELNFQKAKEGPPLAQLNVGFDYKWGRGVVSDIEQAAVWFLKIKAEEDLSLYNTAHSSFYKLYDSSRNDLDDLKKLFPFYLAEATTGDHNAQYIVGKMYLKQRGVEKDDEEARKWFEKALENVNKAAYRLGRLCELKSTPDIERAFAYYKQGKSEKGIKEYIKRKETKAYIRSNSDIKFDSQDLNVAFAEFHKVLAQPAILSDPAQAQVVKESPLGRALTAVEECMINLSEIDSEDLAKKRTGFLLTAVTAKKTVPEFIETFEFAGNTYVSIGKENCALAERVRFVLCQFKEIEEDMNENIYACTRAIRNNSSKLITLAALAIGDEKSQQKYARLSKAQERLVYERERLEAYKPARSALKKFLKLSGSRNADFFDDNEFGFL